MSGPRDGASRTALSALYYPYADVVASPALLEAALYFDKIYIFEPNFFRYPEVESERPVPHSPAMRDLVAAHVVEPIGPQLFGFGASPFTDRELGNQVVRSLLAHSVAADVRDGELLAMTERSAYASWAIPSGQQIFWNGLGVLLTHEDVAIRIEASRPEYYDGFLRRAGLSNVSVESSRGSISESRLRTTHSDLLVEVPFICAESLMLTMTLLACSELELYPFTDSSFHYRVMRRKLCRAAQVVALAQTAARVYDGMREAELALNTLALHLPRLGDLTATRVIELRTECRDALARFREHLHRLRYRIESTPWSKDFQREIAETIETTIEPDLAALRRELETRGKRMGIRVAGAVGGASALPLLIMLAANVPAPVALAAGAGVAASAEAAEYLLDRNSTKQNGLYFLLAAQ